MVALGYEAPCSSIYKLHVNSNYQQKNLWTEKALIDRCSLYKRNSGRHIGNNLRAGKEN